MAAITDPALLAQLETSQSSINSGGRPGMFGGAPRLSPQDQGQLKELRVQQAGGLDALSQYRRVAAAASRLKTSPTRASWLEARIPQENGGFFDKTGAALLNWTVSQQDQDDFQRLRALQSARVLTAQTQQKGPQTESDAARLKLAEVSPYNSMEANKELVRFGSLQAALAAKKAPFFTQWANAYGGLNGLDARGRSIDEVWGQIVADAQNRAEMRAAGKNPDAKPTASGGGWKVVR
jgi:hypothetical protein